MTDIDALETKYFVGGGDLDPPSEDAPEKFANSKVTAFVDGQAYFDDLAEEVAKLGTGPDADANKGHVIYIAGWWLGLAGGKYVPAAQDVGSTGSPSVVNDDPLRLRTADAPLIDQLKAKARVGVDVRALGWVSFAVMGSATAQHSGAASVAQTNALTMETIKLLRAEPAIGPKALLNVISHTAGAVHSKLVVLGTPKRVVAYTGGIDLAESRRALPRHNAAEIWHDVMAKIEGPAVQGPFDLFGDMWTENIERPVKEFKFSGETMRSYLADTPQLNRKEMPVPSPPVGSGRVQTLRTIPQFNYSPTNCMPENEPIEFAPQGSFEFRAAARKAMRDAGSLIYIEDQFFWSRQMLGWANEALKSHAGLHVVLLISGTTDPSDPHFPASYKANAINHGLLDGLTPAQRQRVRLFRRLSADLMGVDNKLTDPGPVTVTTVAPVAGSANLRVAVSSLKWKGPLNADQLEAYNLFLVSADGFGYPVVGNAAAAAFTPLELTVEQPPGAPALVPRDFDLKKGQGLLVHAKVIVVDDECAIVGSANCARRSLYTDVEHSIAVLEAGDMPFAKRLRMELWAHHLGGEPGEYADLKKALHAWDPEWGTPGGRNRPSTVRNWALPLVPDPPLEGDDLSKYDNYHDLDSRQPWGGMCPP